MCINDKIKVGPHQFNVAVHALILLAQSDKGVSSGVLAKKMNVHAAFLRKVLAQLVQTGMIEAKEGRYGGYRLLRDLKRISLAEILTAVDNNEQEIDIGCKGNKRTTKLDDFHEREANENTYANVIEMKLMMINEEIQRQTLLLLNQFSLDDVTEGRYLS